MTLEDALKFLNAGGLLAGTILVIWSGLKELWVPRGALKRETLRADKAEQRADKAETDRDKATEFVQEKALPAIINWTIVAREVLGKKDP